MTLPKSFALHKNKIIIIVVILVVFRAFLPEIIRQGLNWHLGNNLDSYYGHIGDLDLSIYRGAYQLQDVVFKKKNLPEKTAPLLFLKDSDISISWKALFKGKVLLDADFYGLNLSFADSSKKSEQQFGNDENTSNWKVVLDSLIPFRINNGKLIDSSIYFQNLSQKPAVNLFLEKINLTVSDFSNVDDTSKQTTRVTGSAKVMGSANLKLKAQYNYFDKNLNLNGDIAVDDLNLKELNPFFTHYAGFDVSKGQVKIFSELKIKNNEIDSYIKPFLWDLDIVDLPDDLSPIRKVLWEMAAAASNWLAKNSNSKKAALIVPIKGNVMEPQIKIWDAIKSALKNGFVEPLEEKFEDL